MISSVTLFAIVPFAGFLVPTLCVGTEDRTLCVQYKL